VACRCDAYQQLQLCWLSCTYDPLPLTNPGMPKDETLWCPRHMCGQQISSSGRRQASNHPAAVGIHRGPDQVCLLLWWLSAYAYLLPNGMGSVLVS
jgi:hypothetical protein